MSAPPFDSDPVFLKSLIGKTVCVKTVDERCHNGSIYVVDPISKTVVLTNSQTNRLEFILDHAIDSFELHDIKVENNNKMKLIKWLKSKLVDFEEVGENIKVEVPLSIGSVDVGRFTCVIEPPYGKTNCLCENKFVLERIQNFIDLMPTDFN